MIKRGRKFPEGAWEEGGKRAGKQAECGGGEPQECESSTTH
jgi:hypothetical protein